jgi:hypothetical protein
MGRERAAGRADAPRESPPTPPPTADKGTNKPVHEVRLGRIKAAVWANTGESGVWYSVVISRLYKEGDAWKRSESFSRDDLPLVMKVADQVHTWIYEQQGAAEHP